MLGLKSAYLQMVCVWITNVKTFKDNHHLMAYHKDLQMNHIPN